MVLLIKKSGFRDLVFTISSGSAIYNILKIIIFIDLINDVIAITNYLYSKLS